MFYYWWIGIHILAFVGLIMVGMKLRLCCRRAAIVPKIEPVVVSVVPQIEPVAVLLIEPVDTVVDEKVEQHAVAEVQKDDYTVCRELEEWWRSEKLAHVGESSSSSRMPTSTSSRPTPRASQKVYFMPSGACVHLNPTCSGMNTGVQIERRSCMKCWR
jgi:hypothetical protein